MGSVYQCKRCKSIFAFKAANKMYSNGIPYNVCPHCKSHNLTFIKMHYSDEAYLEKFKYANLKTNIMCIKTKAIFKN